MTALYVMVTGTFPDQFEDAFLSFTPAGWVADPADGLLFPPEPVTVTVKGGKFAVQLLATDITDVAWTWALKIAGISGVQPYGFSFALPANAASFTSASGAPGTFTAPGTSYSAGRAVTLAGASVPQGFTAGTPYYVTGPSGDSFSLAAAVAGAALPATSGGSGQVIPAADISALAQVPSIEPAIQYLPKTGGQLGGAIAPDVVTLTQSGGLVAVNAPAANAFDLTLTASGWTVAAPSAAYDGQVLRFRLLQDATGGRTVSWASGYDFGTTGPPAVTAAASTLSIIAFEYAALTGKCRYLGITPP